MPDPLPTPEPSYGSAAATVGLGALAVGGGARLLKQLLDVGRDRDIKTPITGRKLRPAVAGVQVPVTEEEAAALQAQGIRVPVKEAAESLVPVYDQGTDFTGPFARRAGLGALALGGLAAGWKGVDWLAENSRKSKAKQQLEAARARVQRLLDGDPAAQDVKIASLIRAGEDHYITKRANLMMDVANAPMIREAGWVAGPAALMGIVSAFQRAKEQSKTETKARSIKSRYEQGIEPETPTLSMQPVLIRPKAHEAPGA